MNMANIPMIDLIGTFLGFLFTLLVFSYLFTDNPFFRFTLHLFIGVAAGYAAAVAWHSVIKPKLIGPLITGTTQERLLTILPLLLCILMLMKISPKTARFGNPAMAYLVGIGAAAAIGGAVFGTIFPQIRGAINTFDIEAARQAGLDPIRQLANSLVMLLGTLTTLLYFHFGTLSKGGQLGQRNRVISILGIVGQGFVAITFGAMFAGVYTATITALIERLNFLWSLLELFGVLS